MGVLSATLGARSHAQAAPPPPKGFFGIGPQVELTPEDVAYMTAGGIESIRWPVIWAGVQPTRYGGYHWDGLDRTVAAATRGGLQILPEFAGTPSWLSPRETTMPVYTALQRREWTRFLQAAVKRYGPGGEYWVEHGHGGLSFEPNFPHPMPIREWQIWNEANFFYFTYPVSPAKYATLVNISSKAIKAVRPKAKVILSGLFARPNAGGPKGMQAPAFLQRLYESPGTKQSFDGIALHPYAKNANQLRKMVEEFHDVTLRNDDRVPMYITEMGWGSQDDPQVVSFERGIEGQARELSAAYRYMIANWRRLDLTHTYWFSWTDVAGTGCSFCDSVGLFYEESEPLRPKPAWDAFVGVTGGTLSP